MGPQDFQGSRDKMDGMDMMEQTGIQDLQGIMKTQARVMKELPDCQAPQAEKDLGGLQDWDFLVHRDQGGHQETQAAQARGALMV